MGFDRRQLANDTEETTRLTQEGHQSQIWTAMPAIVQKVRLDEMTVDVQPTIQGKIEDIDGVVTDVNLPVLIHVPICFPSAGGFTITMPVAVGDEVLVVIANRCIDGWWASGKISVQAEQRMHDLSDGFAILGPRSVPRVVPNISTTNLQIRNDAGTAYIEMTPGGAINLVGNVTVTGTLSASGGITSGSGPSAIALSTHKHSGVVPGGGTSGVPVP